MADQAPNPVGRPLKFKTKKALETAIETYFNAVPLADWTITGLALALDTTRQTLLDYEDRAEFSDTIKKAKLMVENSYELDVKKYGRTGTIFALKNFGWRDKHETDVTSKGERLIVLPSEIHAKHDAASGPEPDSAGHA